MLRMPRDFLQTEMQPELQLLEWLLRGWGSTAQRIRLGGRNDVISLWGRNDEITRFERLQLTKAESIRSLMSPTSKMGRRKSSAVPAPIAPAIAACTSAREAEDRRWLVEGVATRRQAPIHTHAPELIRISLSVHQLWRTQPVVLLFGRHGGRVEEVR